MLFFSCNKSLWLNNFCTKTWNQQIYETKNLWRRLEHMCVEIVRSVAEKRNMNVIDRWHICMVGMQNSWYVENENMCSHSKTIWVWFSVAMKQTAWPAATRFFSVCWYQQKQMSPNNKIWFVRRPSFVIGRSSFVVRRSSFTHRSFVVCHAFIARWCRHSLVARHSFIIRHAFVYGAVIVWCAFVVRLLFVVCRSQFFVRLSRVVQLSLSVRCLFVGQFLICFVVCWKKWFNFDTVVW